MSEPAVEPADPTADRRSSRRFWVIAALVAAGVLLVDQLTKQWAVDELADRTIDLFWTLRLNLTFNSGMAFSQASGAGPIIGVIALVVIAGLLVSLRRTESVFTAVAVGLVVGGALGNVADRLFRADGRGFLRGEVVDFIDLQWWPIFNIADAAVVVGGILLVAQAVFSPEGR